MLRATLYLILALSTTCLSAGDAGESKLVLHFFGSEDEQRGTILAHLLNHLRETGSFDEGAYWKCLKEGHPWGPGYAPSRPMPYSTLHVTIVIDTIHIAGEAIHLPAGR